VIPLRDYARTRRPSVINTALIAANVAFYLYYFGPTLIPTQEQFSAVMPFLMVPARVSHGQGLETLLTSLFMHGSALHVAGNMLFLYIFGNNIEDDMGRIRYLVFYLACGIAGGLAQSAVDPNSMIPTLGASGAIAGVMAAYLVLHPRAPVLVLLGFIPLVLPALVVIGFWALIQFLSGYEQLGLPPGTAFGRGGVGYFAHIGGFLAGLVLLVALEPHKRRQQRL
jgi:membrane associated rhomboid family serine protease